MSLLNDVCRCLGEQREIHTCARRATCARYTQRDTGGERTPFAECLCPGLDDYYQFFIPLEIAK